MTETSRSDASASTGITEEMVEQATAAYAAALERAHYIGRRKMDKSGGEVVQDLDPHGPISSENRRHVADYPNEAEACAAADGLNVKVALSAALSTIPPTPGAGEKWLPIASAPRDGSEILLLAASYVFIGRTCGDGQNKGWRERKGGVAFPTHWQPLPDPPSVAERVGERR